jgi:hypothetical protein
MVNTSLLICCVSAVASARSCAFRNPSFDIDDDDDDDDDDDVATDECCLPDVALAAAIDNSAGSSGKYGLSQFNESDEIAGS